MNVLVLAGVFGLGCGGSDLAARHRSAAEPQIARIAALARVVSGIPPTTIDRWELPAGVVLDFAPLDLGAAEGASPNPRYNAAIVLEAELTRGCQLVPSSEWFRIQSDSSHMWLTDPICELAGKSQGSTGKAIERAFDQLVRTRYLVVLRTHLLEKPVLAKGETFKPAHVIGDALLFEVATGLSLGGFRFEFSSRDTVEVYDESGRDGQLATKFVDDVDRGIRDKLASLAPAER